MAYKYHGKTYTYAGTKITGTSKSGKVFKKSGIADAAVGQTYFNKSSGHVYKCTKKGKAGEARWAYQGTVVMKAPGTAVTGLTLTRNDSGSRVMTGKWKVPASMVSPDKRDRATSLRMWWKLDTSASPSKKDVVDKESTKNEKATSDTEDLDKLVYTKGGKKITLRRSDFYPFAGKPRLYSLTLSVAGRNGSGTGKWASKTYAFSVPRSPSVSLSFDSETGRVTYVVEADAGEDARERYDTAYEVRVVNQVAGTDTRSTATTKETRVEKAIDFPDFQAVGGKYIAVIVRAWSRGYAGDSPVASGAYYISRPKAPALGAPANDGAVRCPVALSQPEGFPVDNVALEMLRDVTYRNASLIPASAAWEDAGARDNGACTCLTASAEALKPQHRGRRTYLRVKAWHGGEIPALTAYSNVVEAPVSELPAAADNHCTITDASIARADGMSATVVVAWDKAGYAGDDDTTAMQLAWSDDADAWTSTDPPSPFEFDWQDDAPDASAGGEWESTATVKVVGLEPETRYYFRARCVSEDEDAGDASYGEWCAPFELKTTTLSGDASGEPSAVLSAPPVVASGDGIDFTWVVAATGEQTAWELFNDDVTSIAGGDGPAGGCTLPAGRVAAIASGGALECAVRVYVGGGSIESDPVRVVVADEPLLLLSAGDLAAQPFSFVAESDVPGCEVTYAVKAEAVTGSEPDGSVSQVEGDTVAAAAVAPGWEPVEWTSSVRHSVLAAQRDAAQGLADAAASALEGMGEGDDGYEELAAQRDDALAAAQAAQAAMDAGGTAYQATVALAGGMAFHDGGEYSLAAVASDPATGLSSSAASTRFSVAWAHQAAEPPSGGFVPTRDAEVDAGRDYFAQSGDGYEPVEEPDAAGLASYYEFAPGISVEAAVDEDAEGGVRRSATITLAAPEGAAETDVYDVYRGTHDGVQLVGAGYALDASVTDDYAPFGDAGDYFYRICLRTADGDTAWADFDYYLDGSSLRFDWAGKSVELPYDLSISDAFEKDVEVRRHVDGTAEAFWNAGVQRKASLSTSILRIEDAQTAALVRDLAQHPGSVLVRTPDGSAFEANVEVPGLDTSGPVVIASFDVEQIDASAAFMLPRPESEEAR